MQHAPANPKPAGVVFVLGSFVVGVTIRVPRPPALGETLVGDLFDLGPGGKGTNQAVAARRQGGDVRLLACVGRDGFAAIARDLLQQEAISLGQLYDVAGVNTGFGFVTLLPDGENSIVLHPGANARLTPAIVDEAAPMLRSASVVLAQLEVPDAAVDRALRHARAGGARTVLNPAPGRPLAPTLLAQVDVLTPNETEARLLLGLRPDADMPVEELADRLRSLGVGAVVITRGARGAFLAGAGGKLAIAAPRIRAVDPTGAGDCFNGTLAVELSRGCTLEQAVRRGVLAGAYATQFLGAIPGLPTTEQLDTFAATNAATLV